LIEYGVNVDVFDPIANQEEVKQELQFGLISDITKKHYSAIILAVAHDDFKAIDFTQLHNDSTVVFDAKSFIDTKYIDGRL